MSDDISSVFQQRRSLAVAIAELARTEDGRSLMLAARAIYDTYADDLIQAELLRQLETPDSQLRGGLGELAALLPRDQIGAALRGVAADRTQSAQRRLTAAMLASQYLHQTIPAALLNDLSQGHEVAFQSLLDAVEEGKRNRHVLLEYVLQMRQAGDHVPAMILDLLSRLPEADRIELLRLIALDDREGVAINALGRLESLASSSAGDDALRALHVLQFMLPPALTGYVQDTLRRQRFRGNVYRPGEPSGWRSLMSFCDLMGNQVLWFVRNPPEVAGSSDGERDGTLLYLTVNHYTGRIDALADEQLLVQELPARQPIGQITPVDTGANGPVPFLEVPFDFARQQVLDLLPANWESVGELSPEFRLYGDRIWEFGFPETPAKLQRYLRAQQHATQADSGQAVGSAPSMEDIQRDPAMKTWLQHNRMTPVSLPSEMMHVPEDQLSALARAMLVQIEQQSDAKRLAESVAAALRAQAAWFEISGNEHAADLALAFAQFTPEWPISQNPLLLALVQASLSSAEDLSDDPQTSNEDDTK